MTESEQGERVREKEEEGSRTDVASGGRTRVDGNDNTALELEREGGRAVVDLDAARRVGHVVRVELEEGGRLREGEREDPGQCGLREYTLGESGTHVYGGGHVKGGDGALFDSPAEREGVAVLLDLGIVEGVAAG